MGWIKALIKMLTGCQEDHYKELSATYSNEIDILKSKIDDYEELSNPLEDYYNDKYPKKDISYYRTETDNEYRIDVRNFIQGYDSRLPTIEGKDDDEKAMRAISWVIRNIKYKRDKLTYGKGEYWAYGYQTLKHKEGDCEDGAILLHNILLKAGVPYWKLRLTAGWVKYQGSRGGHAYLTYFSEELEKWVILDWCYSPNTLNMASRKDYKEEENYGEIWFSWNKKYCFTQGLNTEARKLLKKK